MVSLRVKRYVPEPKILYERVRAVYAAFGARKDSTKADSKALFTTTAWKKARKNLDNIKKGYVSDPPDVNRYFHKLNNKGGTRGAKRSESKRSTSLAFGVFDFRCRPKTNAYTHPHTHSLIHARFTPSQRSPSTSSASRSTAATAAPMMLKMSTSSSGRFLAGGIAALK